MIAVGLIRMNGGLGDGAACFSRARQAMLFPRTSVEGTLTPREGEKEDEVKGKEGLLTRGVKFGEAR